MSENKTETEQIPDETDEEVEDQTGEDEETTQEDEILTDEQLEEAREVESYKAKIEALDEKLAEFRANSIADIKREKMRAMNYNDEQVERYLSHIEGETVEEIKRSVLELTLDIPPPDNFADPSAFNGAKQRPASVDHSEIGRKAFERVKHKIFPWMGR